MWLWDPENTYESKNIMNSLILDSLLNFGFSWWGAKNVSCSIEPLCCKIMRRHWQLLMRISNQDEIWEDFSTISWKRSLHKKWSFRLRISSVNVTKCEGNCGFGHITEEVLNGKLHFLCSIWALVRMWVLNHQ